jgi:hypothetical protein
LAEVTKKMSGFHTLGIASSSLLCFKELSTKREEGKQRGRERKKREREKEREMKEDPRAPRQRR